MRGAPSSSACAAKGENTKPPGKRSPSWYGLGLGLRLGLGLGLGLGFGQDQSQG